MRKKASVVLLICLMGLAMVGPVAAQEGASSEIPYNNVLYLHPFSLIVSTAVDILPMMIFLTYERALKPNVAMIITPNASFWSLESGEDKFSSTGFGAGIGIRRYLSKPVSGIYLQAKLDLNYTTAELELTDFYGTQTTSEASGVGAAVLGYVGAKGHWGKICMMIDLGIGYQYIGYSFDDEDTDISISGTGLGWDINFGLGYGF